MKLTGTCFQMEIVTIAKAVSNRLTPSLKSHPTCSEELGYGTNQVVEQHECRSGRRPAVQWHRPTSTASCRSTRRASTRSAVTARSSAMRQREEGHQNGEDDGELRGRKIVGTRHHLAEIFKPHKGGRKAERVFEIEGGADRFGRRPIEEDHDDGQLRQKQQVWIERRAELRFMHGWRLPRGRMRGALERAPRKVLCLNWCPSCGKNAPATGWILPRW